MNRHRSPSCPALYQTKKNKPIVTWAASGCVCSRSALVSIDKVLIISSYQASFSTNFMAKSKSQALKDTSVTVVVIGNCALFLM